MPVFNPVYEVEKCRVEPQMKHRWNTDKDDLQKTTTTPIFSD